MPPPLSPPPPRIFNCEVENFTLPCGTVLLGLSCEGGPVQPLYQRLFGDSVAPDPPRYESTAYPSILVNLTGDVSGLATTNDDDKLSLNGHHVYQFADEDFTVNGIDGLMLAVASPGGGITGFTCSPPSPPPSAPPPSDHVQWYNLTCGANNATIEILTTVEYGVAIPLYANNDDALSPDPARFVSDARRKVVDPSGAHATWENRYLYSYFTDDAPSSQSTTSHWLIVTEEGLTDNPCGLVCYAVLSNPRTHTPPFTRCDRTCTGPRPTRRSSSRGTSTRGATSRCTPTIATPTLTTPTIAAATVRASYDATSSSNTTGAAARAYNLDCKRLVRPVFHTRSDRHSRHRHGHLLQPPVGERRGLHCVASLLVCRRAARESLPFRLLIRRERRPRLLRRRQFAQVWRLRSRRSRWVVRHGQPPNGYALKDGTQNLDYQLTHAARSRAQDRPRRINRSRPTRKTVSLQQPM